MSSDKTIVLVNDRYRQRPAHVARGARQPRRGRRRLRAEALLTLDGARHYARFGQASTPTPASGASKRKRGGVNAKADDVVLHLPRGVVKGGTLFGKEQPDVQRTFCGRDVFNVNCAGDSAGSDRQTAELCRLCAPAHFECTTCGAVPGKPCRQVGAGGGQSGPPPVEKLGVEMVTFHAARRRAAKEASGDCP